MAKELIEASANVGHLVLSRKRDEQVVLAYNGEPLCVVTVVDVRGDKVRLGFHAPHDLRVHRREVWDAIESQKAAAAAGGAS